MDHIGTTANGILYGRLSHYLGQQGEEVGGDEVDTAGERTAGP